MFSRTLHSIIKSKEFLFHYIAGRKEDWNKALANFKHSLKLDQSPINPDALGAANTSLTCAVILSKLNKYAESIDYAESCMKAIEDLA